MLDLRLVTSFTKQLAQVSEQLALLSLDRIKPHAAGVSMTRLLSFPANITSETARTYLHTDFDISNNKSNLAYKTGDQLPYGLKIVLNRSYA